MDTAASHSPSLSYHAVPLDNISSFLIWPQLGIHQREEGWAGIMAPISQMKEWLAVGLIARTMIAKLLVPRTAFFL